ncbi:ethylene-responsive transcription factor [Canna indica]|uniref:Ethylene-responsive transcription factor n=1 Tax=Canna indica TaxID=4628 RepID=A0AAQ3K865_9LILI|nr:ethylene-responsive transcription factor [Canna indica]
MNSNFTGGVRSPAPENAVTGGNQREEQQQQSQAARRFKGVRLRNWGSWVAEVRFPNSRERLWLGSYPTAEQAARAFDAAVYCLRGPGVEFNFPEQLPEIPDAGGLSRKEIRDVARQFAQLGGEERREEGSGERTGMSETEGMNVIAAAEWSTSVGVSTEFEHDEEDEAAWAAVYSCDDIYRISPLWNF